MFQDIDDCKLHILVTSYWLSVTQMVKVFIVEHSLDENTTIYYLDLKFFYILCLWKVQLYSLSKFFLEWLLNFFILFIWNYDYALAFIQFWMILYLIANIFFKKFNRFSCKKLMLSWLSIWKHFTFLALFNNYLFLIRLFITYL